MTNRYNIGVEVWYRKNDGTIGHGKIFRVKSQNGSCEYSFHPRIWEYIKEEFVNPCKDKLLTIAELKKLKLDDFISEEQYRAYFGDDDNKREAE